MGLNFFLMMSHQLFNALGDQLQPADDFQPRFVFREGVVCDLPAILPGDGRQQVGDGVVFLHGGLFNWQAVEKLLRLAIRC